MRFLFFLYAGPVTSAHLVPRFSLISSDSLDSCDPRAHSMPATNEKKIVGRSGTIATAWGSEEWVYASTLRDVTKWRMAVGPQKLTARTDGTWLSQISLSHTKILMLCSNNNLLHSWIKWVSALLVGRSNWILSDWNSYGENFFLWSLFFRAKFNQTHLLCLIKRCCELHNACGLNNTFVCSCHFAVKLLVFPVSLWNSVLIVLVVLGWNQWWD